MEVGGAALLAEGKKVLVMEGRDGSGFSSTVRFCTGSALVSAILLCSSPLFDASA